ncbi:hypothetical protein P7C70_g3285, partial [Phenoliferia sp. Uapishka_3]
MSAAELQLQVDQLTHEKERLIAEAQVENTRREKEASEHRAALLALQTNATYAHLQSKKSRDMPEYLDRLREDKLPLVQKLPKLPEFCGSFQGASSNVAADVIEFFFRTRVGIPISLLSNEAHSNMEVSMGRALLEGTAKSRTTDKAILTAYAKKTPFMPLAVFIPAWFNMIEMVRLICDDKFLPARFKALLDEGLKRLSDTSTPVVLHYLNKTAIEVFNNLEFGRPYGDFQVWRTDKMSVYETQFKQHALTVNQNGSESSRTEWGTVLLTNVTDQMVLEKFELDKAICAGEVLHGVVISAMRFTNSALPSCACVPLLPFASIPSHVGGVAVGGGGGNSNGGGKKGNSNPPAAPKAAPTRAPAVPGLFCPICAEVPASAHNFADCPAPKLTVLDLRLDKQGKMSWHSKAAGPQAVPLCLSSNWSPHGTCSRRSKNPPQHCGLDHEHCSGCGQGGHFGFSCPARAK